jgi:hypothetical protein
METGSWRPTGGSTGVFTVPTSSIGQPAAT